MTTEQDQQSRAECRKAFEFELIDNHAYVPSDLNQIDGFYADDDVQFAWESAWAVWQAARALPSGMKPFGYVRRRNGKFYHEVEGLPAADFDVVYTAAQVLAMGRVPPGFIAAPVEPTAEMVDAAEEAYMPFGDMALAIQSAIAAAPRPPAAQAVNQQLTTEAAWDAFAEAVRVKVGVKELVNIMGSVDSLRETFLKAAHSITHPTGD